MAEYTRNPADINNKLQNAVYGNAFPNAGEIIGQYWKPSGGGTNSYDNAAAAGPKVGDYLYAKPGVKLYFYTTSSGNELVGPSGDKNRSTQKEAPSRAGGELVGTYSGQRVVLPTGIAMLQVSWVNSYGERGTFIPPRAFQNINETKTSWVRETEVVWSTQPVDPTNPTGANPQNPANNNGGTGGTSVAGLSTNNLLLLGLAGAVVLRMQKPKRK